MIKIYKKVLNKVLKKLTKPHLYPELTPLEFNFMTSEDFLFERILYIRYVLANPDRYTGAPDKNALNIELYGLLRKYQEIVMKKVNLDEVED